MMDGMSETYAYRCPVCGKDLTVETDPIGHDPFASDATFGLTTTIRHSAPMDAACRWAFEAFADEQRQIMNRTVSNGVDRVFDTHLSQGIRGL